MHFRVLGVTVRLVLGVALLGMLVGCGDESTLRGQNDDPDAVATDDATGNLSEQNVLELSGVSHGCSVSRVGESNRCRISLSGRFSPSNARDRRDANFTIQEGKKINRSMVKFLTKWSSDSDGVSIRDLTCPPSNARIHIKMHERGCVLVVP